jgi:DNA repair exonuclease SbcCD ATPase subunit
MIPLRVRLKGFLCYKDEQEVCFDGASLWMLSGLNGSGKSAIFDAVTYALFGHHRGGSIQAQELVNKNSEGFEVEFDFLQDGQAYRIRRTLKRKAKGGNTTTQQILRQEKGTQLISGNGAPKRAASPVSAQWEAIEGTSKRAEFDDWIRNNIGLTYETFTSSVLLLQGKAERLLDSTAKGRFEVLAGIVDLDRYQRLHERADARRKQLDGEVEVLKNQLQAVQEVNAVDLLEAEGKLCEAQAVRDQVWREVERLQGIEFLAVQCQEVREKLEQSQQKLVQTRTLLADAADIERDETRLKELQAALPTVKNALEQRCGLEDAQRRLAELTERQQHVVAELAQKDDELEKVNQKSATVEAALEKEAHQLRDLNGQLREAAGQLEKLREFERQELDLANLHAELQQSDGDPAKRARLVREQHDGLAALALVVPKLAHFVDARRQLNQAVEQEKTSTDAYRQIESQGKQLKAQLEHSQEQLRLAGSQRQHADDNAAQARALRNEAKKHLDELSQLRGSKVCRHCGQELSPGHLEDEKIRRQKYLAQADEQHRQADKHQQEARQLEEKLHHEAQQIEQRTQQARDEYVKQRERAEQSRKEVERLQNDCRRLWTELPEQFQQKIDKDHRLDWLRTDFPSSDELAELQRQVKELSNLQKRLRDAEKRVNDWNLLKGREANLLQSMLRLQSELPKDRQALRTKHASLEAEEKALAHSLQAKHQLREQAQRELDQLNQQRERIRDALSHFHADIQTETKVEHTCQGALAKFLRELPDTWKQAVMVAGLAQMNGWTQERNELIDKGTEQRVQQLRQAQLLVENLRLETGALEKQLGEFPPEARQGPEAVQQLLQEARKLYKQRDDDFQLARKQFERLEEQDRQHRRLQGDFLAADGQRQRWKLLAELLGRDRLQLYLVRQAERQVVDHANAMLDRLSGGELYLRLCGQARGEDNSSKALELEAHNRVTGEKPINVAFLSGSQKFRVAVSLALGLGQYASRQHRPIESVIIDEGFGCLDRNARQVMIQELQNLRGQMRCILLVSHQEEFADAFADGYHFELQNGTTIARRFQR